MYYVYILKSIPYKDEIYVGMTSDVKARLVKHNKGGNKHTTKFKPWMLLWFCAFPVKGRAAAFEKYLKTSSGIAFRKKRLL